MAQTLNRSTTADTGEGRFAIPSLAASTSQLVQVDMLLTEGILNYWGSTVNRYVDANNYFAASVHPTGYLKLEKKVAGVLTTLPLIGPGVPFQYAVSWTMRTVVYADGSYYVWWFQAGSQPTGYIAAGSETVLATGGALASGQVGIRDFNPTADAGIRKYDNFFSATPSSDAVIWSGRAAEINSQTAQRADSTGTYYGDMRHRGAHFLLQPAGDESRTNEVVLTAKRNDVDTLADDQIADSTTATIHYTPRYWAAPR